MEYLSSWRLSVTLHADTAHGVSAAASVVSVQMQVAFVSEPQYWGMSVARHIS